MRRDIIIQKLVAIIVAQDVSYIQGKTQQIAASKFLEDAEKISMPQTKKSKKKSQDFDWSKNAIASHMMN